tara:strand:+ start:4994 stop:5932 length:939 start_codon:yes stop_codon:yes gene_type:complete
MNELNASSNLNDANVFDEGDSGVNSTDEFFDELDKKVSAENAGEMYNKNTPRVTQPNKGDSEQVTHKKNAVGSNKNAGNWDDENNPYKKEAEQLKKRYADSTRAGQANHNRLKEVESFLPVLDAMKKDSGLVQHVRDYLTNGGAAPKTVQEALGLKEDFVYDGHEAMTDPGSESAKVFNASVDNMVQQRVGQILEGEKQNAAEMQRRMSAKQEALKFQKERGLSNEEMGELIEYARTTPMTLEHIWAAKNQGKRDANISNAAKKDMLGQMKNAQSMPTSASGANNQGGQVSADDQMFASLFGDSIDNDKLFG